MAFNRVGQLIVRHSATLASYVPDDLPSDRVGQMAFDNQRNLPAWFDGDNHEYPTYVDPIDVDTDGQTVSNTADETEVSRFEIDSNSLIQGRLFVLRNFGKYSTASSNDAFTYRVYVGPDSFDPTSGEGTKIAEVTTVQANVTDGPWQVKTTSTVFAEGANGELATHSEGAFNNNKRDDHIDPVTIDTTTGEQWVVTIQWNNAKADNSATQGQSYLQQSA